MKNKLASAQPKTIPIDRWEFYMNEPALNDTSTPECKSLPLAAYQVKKIDNQWCIIRTHNNSLACVCNNELFAENLAKTLNDDYAKNPTDPLHHRDN